MLLKHVLTLAAASAALGLSALTPVKEFERIHSLEVIPARFCYNNQAQLYIYDYDDEEDCRVYDIVDENLNVTERLQLSTPEYTVTTTFVGPKVEMRDTYVYQSDEKSFNSEISATKYIEGIFTEGYVTHTKNDYIYYVEGTTPLSNEIIEVMDSETVGYLAYFMSRQDVYKNFAAYNKYYQELITYTRTGEKGEPYPVVTDEIVQYEPKVRTEGVSVPYMKTFDLSGHDAYTDVYISQTIFNDNAAYEYLKPIYKEISYEEDNVYEYFSGQQVTGKRITQTSVVAGIQAVDAQTGNVVCTFEIPQDIHISNSKVDCTLYSLNTKTYLAIEFDTTESWWTYFYDLSDRSSIKKPVLERRTSVSPTNVRRGEQINVATDDTDELHSVSVVSANGRTQLQRTVSGRSAAIDTSSLPSGVHVVDVHTASGHRSSAKVIVR